MRTVVATLLLGAVLSGCSLDTTNRTLSVITSATNLSYHYTNGDIVTFVGNAELSDMELTSVLEALDQIDRSQAILKTYKDHPDQLILNIEDIAFQYAKIKSSYLTIRTIVLDNIDEYESKEINTFIEFDSAAKVLDKEFVLLVDSVETNAAINTALNLANTAIKIGAML